MSYQKLDKIQKKTNQNELDLYGHYIEDRIRHGYQFVIDQSLIRVCNVIYHNHDIEDETYIRKKKTVNMKAGTIPRF